MASAVGCQLFGKASAASWMVPLDDMPDLAESIDAFCTRFGWLQDTLGDKLLPKALAAQQERTGGFLDNLQAAERSGLVTSSIDFVAARKLRNRLVQDYSENIEALAVLLDEAHHLVPFLAQTRAQLAAVLRAWDADLTRRSTSVARHLPTRRQPGIRPWQCSACRVSGAPRAGPQRCNRHPPRRKGWPATSSR